MRILIIEDERRLASTLADIMSQAGYAADTSHHGEDGLILACSGIFDAIVLDVMLPGLDGFQILKQLRKKNIQTPVLMLTARSNLSDRVQGLEMGADYYLTKPFENVEFLACLRTILRRQGEITPDTLQFGDLLLTPSRSELRKGERQVVLSARELEMMRLLFANNSQLLSKETILLKVWGYDTDINDNSVEAYISFLRKKLALLGSAVRISVTRKIGYRLEVNMV